MKMIGYILIIILITINVGCLTKDNSKSDGELYIILTVYLKPNINENYSIFLPIPIIVNYNNPPNNNTPISILYECVNNNIKIEKENGSYYYKIFDNGDFYLNINKSIPTNNQSISMNWFDKLSSNKVCLSSDKVTDIEINYSIKMIYINRLHIQYTIKETVYSNTWQIVNIKYGRIIYG